MRHDACHAIAMTGLFRIDCAQPWLVARFPKAWRMHSWSMNRPGLVRADRVAWLEVKDADLPLGRDPHALLRTRLAAAGLDDALAMMTARDIRRHRDAETRDGDAVAHALATLGLTNGVGFDPAGRVVPRRTQTGAGTINILAAVTRPLSEPALLEAMAIVATARTAALLAEGGSIAATGTDCIVVACPDDEDGERYAGLHTAAGRAIAGAVYAATRAARADWESEFTT
jgi:adenosylcobinamide amidohydrolase